MPLYFFDIIDGGPQRDNIGSECASEADIPEAVKRALPNIASEEIPGDGDRRFFTVVARTEEGHAVYTATLSYAGIWLKDRPEK